MLVAAHTHLASGTEFSSDWIEKLRGAIDILRRVMAGAAAYYQDSPILLSRRRVRSAGIGHAAGRAEFSSCGIIDFGTRDSVFLAILAASNEYASVREKRGRASRAFDDQVSRGRECICSGIVNLRRASKIIAARPAAHDKHFAAFQKRSGVARTSNRHLGCGLKRSGAWIVELRGAVGVVLAAAPCKSARDEHLAIGQ